MLQSRVSPDADKVRRRSAAERTSLPAMFPSAASCRAASARSQSTPRGPTNKGEIRILCTNLRALGVESPQAVQRAEQRPLTE